VIPLKQLLDDTVQSFERSLKGDVKYRLVIDMASLKQTVP